MKYELDLHIVIIKLYINHLVLLFFACLLFVGKWAILGNR